MDGWREWEGKKVYVILKNERKYSGTVVEVEIHSNDWVWISLRDRYGKTIGFSAEQIEVIQEEGNEK